MLYRYLLLASLLFAVSTKAQTRGLDLIGLAMLDVDMIAEELPQGHAVGILDGTFGDPAPAMDRLLSTGKVSMWRVHLLNGPCHRNKNCASDEPKIGDIAAMQRRAAKWEKLYKKYPDIPYFISPVLEHDEKDPRKVLGWVTKIREAAPNARIIVNAFMGATLPDIQVERHGYGGNRAAVVSPDGIDVTDMNIDKLKRENRSATILFSWTRGFNLRSQGGSFVPPKERKAKITRANLQGAIHILDDKPAPPVKAPASCRTARKFEGEEIYKPLAEDYPSPPDVRANKPVAILKATGKTLKAISPDGRDIGKFGYYGNYPGGLNRFYSGYNGGNQHGYELEKLSPWIYLQDERRNCYGPLNGFRRNGKYK